MGKFIEDFGLAAATSGLGVLNTGIQYLFNQKDKEDEKQWWYEQQKYIEEHNTPAYRAMLMRKAGLNPYTEVSSTPLGNVDSTLPRINAPHTFDVNAIQNSLLLNAQRENIEQDTDLKSTASGLNEEKIKTESEWRSNIIQQTLNLQQAYELGLITKEDANFRLQEFKDAYNAGYNSYLIDMDLKKSTQLLNDSLQALHVKQGEKIDKENELLAVEYAAATFELILDKFYSAAERSAHLKGVRLDNAFTEAEFAEFLDTQEVRIALFNVQKAFSKFAVDAAARQDALDKIDNEYDRHIAQQILDASKDGDSMRTLMLKEYRRDAPSLMNAALSFVGAISPRTTFNRSSSTTHVIRENKK